MQLLLYISYDKNDLYKFVTSKCFLVPITTALSTRVYYRIKYYLLTGKLLQFVMNWKIHQSFLSLEFYTIEYVKSFEGESFVVIFRIAKVLA